MTDQDGRADKDDELDVAERAELEQLRAEKREWIIERDILKKGMAFVCHERAGKSG